MKIELIQLDLSKMSVRSENEIHPDIKPETTHYLIKFDGSFYAGVFRTVWYGIYFDGVFDAGCQLAYPGWEGIWEIVEGE